MKNKPPYPLGSVDNALRLLQMLRDEGRLRVSEAAAELGTARSTAHRLLAMLVYRDFAVQDDSRSYVPGPALSAGEFTGGQRLRQLRYVLLPHMDALCDRVGETVNLMVRIGTQARVLASVESTQLLHVGDRQGTILPAHLSSGGKALLAELSEHELAELYLAPDTHDGDTGDEPVGGPETGRTDAAQNRDGAAVSPWSGAPTTGATTTRAMSATEFRQLCAEMAAVRRQGYALNLQGTETGICAIGLSVPNRTARPIGAVSVAVPSSRFSTETVGSLAAQLRFMMERAQPDLDRLPEL